ncbi:MAG TPA: 16S rRNA (guanine(527)-N(7))-methyltransferase RsmG [Dehalococcoidia bacterium]|nr:16S rRNA (guanine(527)-N(7))-methyltransferase RsmG [Dehalococcoidia bacterium]
MTTDPLGGFQRSTEKLGFCFDSRTRAQFEALLDLLHASNAVISLTSLRGREDVMRRHLLESLAIGIQLERRGLLLAGERILDLGTGAGFPGLPLKIAWPDIEISLLEATGKKAQFVRAAISRLEMSGAAVLEGRAETLAHEQGIRAAFGLAVARAVAPLPALVELALPFIRLGGTLAALKGSRVAGEVKDAARALLLCGGEVSELLPEIEGSALGLLLIRKTSPTPDRYPRRPGQPARHPLVS